MEPSSECSFDQHERTDLESLQPTAELCAYYRTRISAFEKEREEMLDLLKNSSTQRDELHRTQWELNKRVEEVKDLQKALSDAHTYLFEERQRLLDLQAENDELKLQEMDDRKRIQHLLALTEPVEQEITYGRDTKADTFKLLPTKSSRVQGNTITGVPRPNPPHMHQPVQPCERVMRTVYLPTTNVESLLLKCESLQAQLNEQKRFSNERIAALLEDRRIREADEDAYRKTMERRLQEQTDKLKHTEGLLAITTRDYIIMRRQAQHNEQVKMEKTEALRNTERENQEVRLDLQMRHEDEVTSIKYMLLTEHETAISQLRAQLKHREEELVGINGVHAAVMVQYQNRLNELETQLAAAKDRYKKLEGRRTLDLEGFARDVTLLRQQLNKVERQLHQMRLVARLEDQDRLDTLLQMLEQRVPEVERAPASKPARPRSAGPARPTGPALSAFRAVPPSAPEGRKVRKSGVVAKKMVAPSGHLSQAGVNDCNSDVDKIKAAVAALERRVAALPPPDPVRPT